MLCKVKLELMKFNSIKCRMSIMLWIPTFWIIKSVMNFQSLRYSWLEGELLFFCISLNESFFNWSHYFLPLIMHTDALHLDIQVMCCHIISVKREQYFLVKLHQTDLKNKILNNFNWSENFYWWGSEKEGRWRTLPVVSPLSPWQQTNGWYYRCVENVTLWTVKIQL